MTSSQQMDGSRDLGNFSVDFKNLIGFAVALWESAQTETLFQG